mgnify:FL=1
MTVVTSFELSIKLSITLDPTIEEFEEQLLVDLNHDRLMKNNISPDDGLNVKIIERRLKVSAMVIFVKNY